MKQVHKHAVLIKLWADGAVIQFYVPSEKNPEWRDCHNNQPGWCMGVNYRVKPEPKPDVVRYRFMCLDQSTYPTKSRTCNDNIMFVFDGETGVLKDVQLLAEG